MNISFTLNQAEALASSEVRYYDFYYVMRSYAGVLVGELYSPEQLSAALTDTLFLQKDVDGTEFYTIRGVRYDALHLHHAISVHSSLMSLKVALQFVKEGGSVSVLSRCVKALKQDLSTFEW